MSIWYEKYKSKQNFTNFQNFLIFCQKNLISRAEKTFFY